MAPTRFTDRVRGRLVPRLRLGTIVAAPASANAAVSHVFCFRLSSCPAVWTDPGMSPGSDPKKSPFQHQFCWKFCPILTLSDYTETNWGPAKKQVPSRRDGNSDTEDEDNTFAAEVSTRRGDSWSSDKPMTRALVLFARSALFMALASELGHGLMHYHQRQPFPTYNCSHLHH